MRRFIFGFDAAYPQSCAEDLKKRGFDAVIVGDISLEGAAALQEAGIDLYLCFGAHSLGNTQPQAGHLALNPQGKPRIWFSSACPNDSEIADARLTQALGAAQRIPGVKGVFVDGARFASFASPEGMDAFFTCFCPRCTARMRGMGLDPEVIRQSVLRLSLPGPLDAADVPRLRDWLRFREACVKAYMEHFASSVHACNPAWTAGAFIFAPSLGGFVGQTMTACASLDIVSPMMYRAYPHVDGPACLGHEWAAFHRLLQEKAAGFRSLVSTVIHHRLTSNVQPDPESLLTGGFSPTEVGAETAAARCSLAPQQQLAPIVQIEDERLQETIHCVLESGADGVGCFAYDSTCLPPITHS